MINVEIKSVETLLAVSSGGSMALNDLSGSAMDNFLLRVSIVTSEAGRER